MPRSRDALDLVMAERLERQQRKGVDQLYAEQKLRQSKKVSNFEEWKSHDKVDLSYIPGRSRVKENVRAQMRRKQQEAEAEAAKKKSQIDWTTTDEYGNLEVSVNAQVLELSGVKDPSAAGRDGPIYPRGKLIEATNLANDLEHVHGTTFDLLKPRRLADYNPDESVRYALAKGAIKTKPFELVEPDNDFQFVNPQTGKVDDNYIYLNSMGVSDEVVFQLGRGLERSEAPQLLDLFGNHINEGTAVYAIERLNDGLAKGFCKNLNAISFGSNILGPRAFQSFSTTLSLSKNVVTLDLSNLFDPMVDEDGAELMRGLGANKSLRNLNVCGNLLGKEFCWELKIALRTNKTLETINLEANAINDDSSYFIGESLVANPENQVTHLYMGWNTIEHVGFGSLMEAAGCPHSKLKLLNLRNNKISRCTSGDVVNSVARAPKLEILNLGNNRIADMTEIGLGLYFNRSLLEINLSENNLANDAFGWFANWGKKDNKRIMKFTRLRRLDLRQNKLGDTAGLRMVEGLMRRKRNRSLVKIDLEDNLMDQKTMRAVNAMVNPSRPFLINKKEARAFLKSKRSADKAYWKEREWETLQTKKKHRLDQAVTLLNSRTDDEVELDVVLHAPVVSKIPLVRTVAVAAQELVTGVKPVWKYQMELINEQKIKASRDIMMRKSLVKGFDKK